MRSLKEDIFNIKCDDEFNRLCMEIFNIQSNQNVIYKKYIKELKINSKKIKHYTQIPFLPIDFFKTHKVIMGNEPAQIIFKSSGTTGSILSKHYVTDALIYERSFTEGFKLFYGSPEEYTFLALLPSYLEKEASSLVYMAEKLMTISRKNDNGFYLYEHDELNLKLIELEKKSKKTILFGVSFALTDFFDHYNLNLKHTIIIETGGMKGRKEEITKEELHSQIKKGSGIEKIHSEYGMTELLSQAYSKGENKFYTPPWMKILVRDPNDPFEILETGKTGGINIIDLANINSCAFIETKDLGKLNAAGSFEISGRFDHSDIRGCNLMVI